MKNLISAVLFLLAASAVFGANPSRDALERYYSTMKRHGVESTVKLMHPESVKDFRNYVQNILLRVYEQAPEQARIDWFLFTNGQSVEEIQRLSDEEFVRRFLEFSLPPEANSILRNLNYEILGSVKEGQDEHFVVRLSYDANGANQSGLTVMTVRPSGGEPMIILPADLKGMAGL